MLNKITSQFQRPINKRPFTPPFSDKNAPSSHPGALTQDTVTLSRTSKPRFGAAISDDDKQRAVVASQTGDIATLQALQTQYDLDLIQMKDEAGKTIWHHAAENRRKDVLKALFQAYARRSVVSRVDLQSFDFQAYVSSPALNVDEKDNNGRTALGLAAARGHGSVVKFLLEKGASPICKDNENRQPRDLAIQNKHYKVSQQIRRAQLAKIADIIDQWAKERFSQICALQDQLEAAMLGASRGKNKSAHNLGDARRVVRGLNAQIGILQNNLQNVQNQLTQEQFLTQHLHNTLNTTRQQLTTQQAQNQRQANTITQQARSLGNKKRFIVKLKRTRAKHNLNTKRKVQRYKNNFHTAISNLLTQTFTTRQVRQSLRQMTHRLYDAQHINWQKGKHIDKLSNNLNNTQQQATNLTNQLNTQQNVHQQQVAGFQNQIQGLNNDLNNVQQQAIRDQRQITQLNAQVATNRVQKQHLKKKYLVNKLKLTQEEQKNIRLNRAHNKQGAAIQERNEEVTNLLTTNSNLKTKLVLEKEKKNNYKLIAKLHGFEVSDSENENSDNEENQIQTHSNASTSSSTISALSTEDAQKILNKVLGQYIDMESRLKKQLLIIRNKLDEEKKKSNQNTELAQQTLNQILEQYLKTEATLRKHIGTLRRKLTGQQRQSEQQLRETVAYYQNTLLNLQNELNEERSRSSSVVNNIMDRLAPELESIRNTVLQTESLAREIQNNLSQRQEHPPASSSKWNLNPFKKS